MDDPELTVDCGAQQTLTATADAWIDSGRPDGQQGLRLDPQGHVEERRQPPRPRPVHLPTMPQGCVGPERDAPRVRQVGARPAARSRRSSSAAPGREGGVTWANQPATTGGAVTTTSGTGYREWNVAASVQAMYSGSEQRLPRPRREREPGRRAAVPQPRGRAPTGRSSCCSSGTARRRRRLRGAGSTRRPLTRRSPASRWRRPRAPSATFTFTRHRRRHAGGQPDLPVPARRARHVRLDGLHDAAELLGPRRRLAHLPRARQWTPRATSIRARPSTRGRSTRRRPRR